MSHLIKIIVVGMVVALVAGWLWRRWRTAQQEARRQLAMLQFSDLREPLQREFLVAAEATGKPRGLHWKNCELAENMLFVCDRNSGDLCAFVAATISFEAIVGGDMEDVEAVGNLRSATAIFVYRGGCWTTDGRVVFNLEPEEALERFGGSLEGVE